VLVAAQVVVVLELWRCVQQRHLLLEDRRDPVAPAMVAGQGTGARDVHDDIVGVQYKEALEVAGVEQLAGLPHELGVGVFHGNPAFPAGRRGELAPFQHLVAPGRYGIVTVPAQRFSGPLSWGDVVGRDGIEPPTLRFSAARSTD
jgi:hypothetical protein